MKKISFKQCSAAILSGFLLFLASPGSFAVPQLAWIAMVPLIYAITRPGTRPLAGGLLGLLTGLLYFPLLLYWIIIVLGNYGQLPLWASLPLLLLLSLYMSIYLASFSLLAGLLQKRFNLLLVAPLAWVGLEWLRGWLFTGFPWVDLAYTQFRSPRLIQVSDLAGHYGVSLLVVMVNILAWQFTDHFLVRKQRPGKPGYPQVAAILILCMAMVYGLVRFNRIQAIQENVETITVGIVQGNVPQGQKWLPSLQQRTLDKYIRLSHQIVTSGPTDLLVWPETAMPFYLAESRFLNQLENFTALYPGSCLMTGAPYREKSRPGSGNFYFNSAFLVGPEEQPIRRYDKQHLVPFGEYVPLKKMLPFLAPFVESVADFSAGFFVRPIPCKNSRLGVLICFESIFPNLARRQAEAGANLLVNLTNDAWYGRSSAPWQHLSMAVFRAVENRRSLVRSANTGVSGFITPAGEMLQLSPLFEDYTGRMAMPLLRTKTVFTNYGGGYSGLLCLVTTIMLTLFIYLTGSHLIDRGE